jgi:heat shock protein HslJ
MPKTSIRSIIVAASLIAVFAVAACGPPAPPSLTRSSWPVTMAGTSWTAIRVGNLATVVGSEPTVAFTADRFQGTTGCNSYGGLYRYANGVIKVGEVTSTLALCDGPVGATEARFMAAIGGASSVSIDPDGRLVLDGSGGSITFVVGPQPVGS